ncbi:DUF2529 family protein [Aureibacillus halotolerans]|uniref:Uncharacterized protein DUF2529 n=1 Tax=Aureibacillus halotolerans TaxID=1508390 RepID=A0A4R6TXX7_9BACI|nr:DUF2529 family protein [Aureibacillus halotolerans]TDQ38758.1 uncharacterized protein DUF2529 [Aureibacillus halotolerans]
MFQIIPTQLFGHFKAMAEEEPAYEDGARLLAQANHGTLYLFTKEDARILDTLNASTTEQTSLHAMTSIASLDHIPRFTTADRVIIAVPREHHTEAVSLCQKAQSMGAQVLALSTSDPSSSEKGLYSLADIFISMHVKDGLYPNENGKRVVIPHAFSFLMAYYWLSLTVQDILDELH